MSNPVLSVALPMFRAKPIAWLALESLCRQTDAPPWELLIAEETKAEFRPVGLSAVRSYFPRLEAAGCVRIEYRALPKWVPLSQKWRMLAQTASPSSLGFLLQAADCYSPARRLAETGALFQEGADWVHSRYHVLYHLCTGKLAILDQQSTPHPCGADMAVATDLAASLPDENVARGVDRWIYEHGVLSRGDAFRSRYDESDNWSRSLNVHGLNNLSARNEKMDTLPEAPGLSLESILPEECRARLLTLRDEANQWQLLPQSVRRMNYRVKFLADSERAEADSGQ